MTEAGDGESQGSWGLAWGACAVLATALLLLVRSAVGAETVDPRRVQIERSVPRAQGVDAEDPVLASCDVGAQVAAAVAGAHGSVVPVERLRLRRGRSLALAIVDVHAPSGGLLSGAKSLTVTGALRENGALLGSFTAKESALVGGLTTCAQLERAAGKLGDAIAGWLDAPARDALLGEATRADLPVHAGRPDPLADFPPLPRLPVSPGGGEGADS
jgi:hypothetical protein